MEARPARGRSSGRVRSDTKLSGGEFDYIRDQAASWLDPEWYLNQYPEVEESGLDPHDHYRTIGLDENFSPHPLFDAEFYITTYPDIAKARIPAAIHYIVHGGREWRRPCAFIDMDRYYEFWRKEVEATQSRTIVEEFLQSKDRAQAFRFLDLSYYRPVSAGPDATPNEILVDFVKHGIEAGRDPHLLIDLDALDLTGAPIEKRTRFSLLFTAGNELSTVRTHPLIDPAFYQRKHGQLAENAVIHYLRYWRSGDRWPHPLFDSGYYLRKAELKDSMTDPLSHFVLKGEAAGLRPNAYFDCAFYRRHHGEKLGEDDHPMNHYMEHGHMVWFQPSEEFGQRYYHSRYPEAVALGEPLLVHFLHTGSAVGFKPLPQRPLFDRTTGLSPDEIVALIKQAVRPVEDPLVSVIVPAYKNVEYTLRCVLSMLDSGDETPFEIVIADDKSPDGSGEYLARELDGLPGIRAYVNAENLGFLLSCNHAVTQTQTEYVFFLNNDTAVLPGWLDEMFYSFKRDRHVGLVGSKLIYPTGLLQEAGGIIWDGGVCANYGRLDDPGRPEFNYERDADYVSGASIMILRRLWDHLGGFDRAYVPAYYEDSDLAMKVRASGMRVVYQPRSVVIHYEGISSGTDTSSGVKRFQVINKEKFKSRWEDDLKKHGEPGDMSLDCIDRRAKGRILIFDAETPMPDKDSGSITAFYYMQLLTELGYRVTLVPENLLWCGRYSVDLQRMGVEVIHAPYATNARAYVMANVDKFDMFILSRVTSGGAFFAELKAACQDKPIVFDTVDIHHLRMMREYELTRDIPLLHKALETKQAELDVIRSADATIVVSSHEVSYLRDEIGPFPSVVIPLIYEPMERLRGYEARRDIAFVGGYRHSPNVDAVKFLVDEIWPRFRELGADCRLHIIGSHMPAEFQDYADSDIAIVGFVEDLESYLAEIRMTVAPLRFGAGVKGKVGNSLRMGVPVVGTRVATEGMGLEDGKHVLVGSNAASLAHNMAKVYGDCMLWETLSVNGKAYIDSQFGVEAARSKLEALVRGLLRKPI